jgi:hypothetical protein
MRLVLSGNTQLLHTLMVGIDTRWPHVNVHQCQLFFPDGTLEAGNAGASVKIGGSGLTTDMTDTWDVLTEGDRKFIPTQGSLMNGVSLKSTYVRGSANNTILIVEPHIG